MMYDGNRNNLRIAGSGIYGAAGEEMGLGRVDAGAW